MKKPLLSTIIAVAFVSSAAFFASCDEETGITLDIPQSKEEIFEFDQLGATSFDTTNVVPMNLDSILLANSADRSNIESITLTEVKLTKVDSAGNELTTSNFNSLTSVNSQIAENTTGALFTTIATLNPVPQNVSNINLGLAANGFDLTSYVTLPAFKVRLQGALSTPVTTKFFIKVKVGFLVKAKI